MVYRGQVRYGNVSATQHGHRLCNNLEICLQCSSLQSRAGAGRQCLSCPVFPPSQSPTSRHSLLSTARCPLVSGLSPATTGRTTDPPQVPPAAGLKQRCLRRVLSHVLPAWGPFSSTSPSLPHASGKAILRQWGSILITQRLCRL